MDNINNICVSYCFENPESKSGFTTKSLTQQYNPRKEMAYNLERVFKAAEETEKKPIILVGFITF